MNVPAAYELKAIYPSFRDFFNVIGDMRGLMSAPVYFFPDQMAFDSEELREFCDSQLDDELHIPHDQIIFEVADSSGNCQSYIAYCTKQGEDLHVFLLLKGPRRQRWSPPLIRLVLSQSGAMEIIANPVRCTDKEKTDIATEAALGMLIRALGVLARDPEIKTSTVPLVHRRKGEKAGVSGWVWHTVRIDPSKLTARGACQGGTHASPRWHIRRGHWRNLADGRRVFVREAQVGDMARGGVVKDYEVAA